MNIMHYFLGFPPLHSGGLMIYARDLAKEQLIRGNNVIMLMPGKYKANSNKSFIKYFKTIEGLSVYQIINGVPFSAAGVSEPQNFLHPVPNNDYEDFLVKNRINVVHIHSLIGFPKELAETINNLKIKSFYTSHDYFCLCPTIYLFNDYAQHCTNFKDGLECVRCNLNINNSNIISQRNMQVSAVYQILNSLYQIRIIRNTYRFIKKIIKKENNHNLYDSTNDNKSLQTEFVYKNNLPETFIKLRNYHIEILKNINVLIFNSSVAMNVYSKYIDLKNMNYLVLPVTHKKIKDNRKTISTKKVIHDKTHFTYMGYLDKKKGFVDLVDVLERIKVDYSNWDISIYGDYSTININKYSNNHYHFFGRYDHDELSDIFSKTDILIMPSKWKETFGFIGLEAMSYGIPVLVSKNVGFSDLINSGNNGIIYNNDKDNQGLYRAIANILDNPSIIEEYKENIQNKDFNYGICEHAEIIDEIYNSEY